MKLPNSEAAAIAPEKLRDYLLSETHPIGRYKAAFFRHCGYGSDEWEILANDIRELLSEDATELESNEYGRKYTITGAVVSPDGRELVITTVWIILTGEDFPRFVTAYPED